MLTWFARDDTPGPASGRACRCARRAPPTTTPGATCAATSRDFLKPFEPRWTEADLSRARLRARLKRGREEARRGTDYSFLIFLRDRGSETPGRRHHPLQRPPPRRPVRQPRLLDGPAICRPGPDDRSGRRSSCRSASKPLACTASMPPSCPHNMACRRVLEKNGFREEGYAENYLQIDGRWADHVLFGLTRERYDARRLSTRRPLNACRSGETPIPRFADSMTAAGPFAQLMRHLLVPRDVSCRSRWSASLPRSRLRGHHRPRGRQRRQPHRRASISCPATSGKVQLSTAPGEDGIIRRIEVLASRERHQSQLGAVRAAQRFRRADRAPAGRAVLPPARLRRLPPRSRRRAHQRADPQRRHPPGPPAPTAKPTSSRSRSIPAPPSPSSPSSSSGTLPELYLWKPDAYRDYVNSFTLFRGVVLGVASLAAVFLTIMFVVQGQGHLPRHRRLRLGRADLPAHRFRRARPAARHLQRRHAAVPRRRRGRHRHDSVRVPVHLSQPPPLAPALHPPGAGAGRGVPRALRLCLLPARDRRDRRAAGAGAARRHRLLPDPAAGAARLRPRRAAGAHLDHLHRLAVLRLAGDHRAGLQRRRPAGRRRRPRAHRHAARLHLGAARLLRRAGVDRHAQRSRAPRPGAHRLGRLRLRLEHRARPRRGLRRTRAPASASAAARCAAPSSAGSTASTPRIATASAPPSTRWSNCAAARSRPTCASPPTTAASAPSACG